MLGEIPPLCKYGRMSERPTILSDATHADHISLVLLEELTNEENPIELLNDFSYHYEKSYSGVYLKYVDLAEGVHRRAPQTVNTDKRSATMQGLIVATFYFEALNDHIGSYDYDSVLLAWITSFGFLRQEQCNSGTRYIGNSAVNSYNAISYDRLKSLPQVITEHMQNVFDELEKAGELDVDHFGDYARGFAFAAEGIEHSLTLKMIDDVNTQIGVLSDEDHARLLYTS